MANLNASIQALATDFARAVLSALRGASLSDLVELTSGKAPRAAGRGKAKGRTPRPGWPKCQTCGKNAHPRGKGYCWEHALAAGVVKAGAGGPTKAKAKAKPAKRKATAKK